MKICAECKLSLSLDLFATNKNKSDGKSDKCKVCKKVYNAEYYKRTKNKHNPNRASRLVEARKIARQFVSEIKRINPCEDCGKFFHPIAMDFDHVEGVKIADVSTLVRQGASLDKISLELRKCNLVCSNCHRLRTGYRLGILNLEDVPNMKIRATHYAGKPYPEGWRELTVEERLEMLDDLEKRSAEFHKGQ